MENKIVRTTDTRALGITNQYSAEEIVEKGLGHILPPSSPMFFRSMVKKVIQDLNQNALIRRYPGSADVLNPTSNIEFN